MTTTPEEIKTTDDLRKFMQETENGLTQWANKKAEATGYPEAVTHEMVLHKLGFYFYSVGRVLDLIDRQAARIAELEGKQ